MKAAKIRELDDNDLRTKEREFSDQLFRIRFQIAAGQGGSVKKLRELRKDISRIKTTLRERELGKTHGKG
jgi:large subunit ribosomal protein L29